ncbi:MAG: DEAD/DEAH box helicase family protein [Fimbriimonas sp.]|nr:DEAD/DEAH box helicase family protein [Fimbriimonas sp.]
MQEKDYQRLALERLDLYLETLSEERTKADAVEKVRRDNPGLPIPAVDYPHDTWERLRQIGQIGRDKTSEGKIIPYSSRLDGCGRVVPNVTLKVPTGGGKTFLAVRSLAKILDKHFGAVTGSLVLWIVPSEAIYRQTKVALTNQEHPLRRLLNTVSAGKVKILEKDSPLHKDDVTANLCILMLMLPSANRQDAVNKLRMFKDRGNVNGFLPPEDDVPAHSKLVAQHPNLDFIGQADLYGNPTEGVGMVRNSLGNVLRLLRPLVVLDEGHKGFSDLAHKTLYGFNPRFVLELSATPKDGNDKHANWLVNIKGSELWKEEMIKMPVELTARPEGTWQSCLAEAWDKIKELTVAAKLAQSNGFKYIRPILLIQVERVGDDQQESGYVHALAVREHLLQLGLGEDEIAIKTSELDELKGQDLLLESNRIRAIITKQALQEGWDCPFAYVLCSLAVSRNASAMTQLVGRILRQPYAQQTKVKALDQCYVFTCKRETGYVVRLIKDALEGEGMGDLASQVHEAGSKGPTDLKTRERRPELRGKKFFLPTVLVVEGESRRDLDWETDILGRLNWDEFSIADSAKTVSKSTGDERGGVVLIDFKTATPVARVGGSLDHFDLEYTVRVLSDLVPNPWVAYRVVSSFLEALRTCGWTDAEVAAQQSYLRSCLEDLVRTKIDLEAEKVFDLGLSDGSIVLDLVTEPWWVVPASETVTGTRKLRNKSDEDFEKNLFDPQYEGEMNSLEYAVACYLDRREMVWWWYRNVVKGQGYGLQGWRRNRIYPDFIVARGDASTGVEKWLVLETKGDHLENPETAYKAAVGEKLVTAYQTRQASVMGQLTLYEQKAKYGFKIIQEGAWESHLAGELNSD